MFDRHCVRCHDYGQPAGEKLNLAGDLGLVFNTSYLELHRQVGAALVCRSAGRAETADQGRA